MIASLILVVNIFGEFTTLKEMEFKGCKSTVEDDPHFIYINRAYVFLGQYDMSLYNSKKQYKYYINLRRYENHEIEPYKQDGKIVLELSNPIKDIVHDFCYTTSSLNEAIDIYDKFCSFINAHIDDGPELYSNFMSTFPMYSYHKQPQNTELKDYQYAVISEEYIAPDDR